MTVVVKDLPLSKMLRNEGQSSEKYLKKWKAQGVYLAQQFRDHLCVLVQVSVLLSILAFCQCTPWEAAGDGQVVEYLPLTVWETLIEFQAPSFNASQELLPEFKK